MKKTFKSYILLWAVLLILFNVIAFVGGGVENTAQYTPSFWVGYSFITVAFIGQLLCARAAFQADNLKKMFYNLSLISISYTGLIVSFVFGGLCMLLSFLPYWIGVVACVIVLAVTAIAVIKATVAIDAVEAIDEKVKVQTLFIRSLTVDAEVAMEKAKTEEEKALAKKVYEAVRYSDPMSHDALAGLETQINLKFAAYAASCDATVAEELLILLSERNKKCKLLK